MICFSKWPLFSASFGEVQKPDCFLTPTANTWVHSCPRMSPWPATAFLLNTIWWFVLLNPAVAHTKCSVSQQLRLHLASLILSRPRFEITYGRRAFLTFARLSSIIIKAEWRQLPNWQEKSTTSQLFCNLLPIIEPVCFIWRNTWCDFNCYWF